MVEPLANLGPTTSAELTPLELLPASDAEVLRATLDDTLTRNPTPSLYRYLFDTPDPDEGEIIDANLARQELEEEGLNLTIPDQGISQAYFDVLRQRKRKEVSLQNIMARSKGGFTLGVGQFLTGLAGSALDPVNIASAFIPVVGQARYANMVARASGAVGRAGVRAGVGLAEGAVGAALVEPIVYGVAQSEQADYDMYDSLINVAFGSVLGAGLHPAAGFLKDKYNVRLDAEGLPVVTKTREAIKGIEGDFLRLSKQDKIQIMTRAIELEGVGQRANVQALIAAKVAELDAKTAAAEKSPLPADTAPEILNRIQELKNQRATVVEDLQAIQMATSDTDDFIIAQMPEQQKQTVKNLQEKFTNSKLSQAEKKKAQVQYNKIISRAKKTQVKSDLTNKTQMIAKLQQEQRRLTKQINDLHPAEKSVIDPKKDVSGNTNRLNELNRAAIAEQADAMMPENSRIFDQEDINAVKSSVEADGLDDLDLLILNADEIEAEAQARAIRDNEIYEPVNSDVDIDEALEAVKTLLDCKSGLT